jgi:hypothetical protein
MTGHGDAMALKSLLLRVMTASAFAFALVAAVRAADTAESFSGSAFAIDSDALLYRETHFMRAGSAGREHIVLYRCPDGRPFARKLSRDDGDAQAPDFDLTDARLGYREGVRRVDGRREVYVQRSSAQPEQKDVLRVPADGVIDMGFEILAQDHWQELLRGDTLRFNFLVPSRRTFFAFKVNRVAPAVPAAGTATFRLAAEDRRQPRRAAVGSRRRARRAARGELYGRGHCGVRERTTVCAGSHVRAGATQPKSLIAHPI